ncbi:MAG TPA: hypothetical protein VF719_13140, partial [Abditibacteriaceae bacterium]
MNQNRVYNYAVAGIAALALASSSVSAAPAAGKAAPAKTSKSTRLASTGAKPNPLPRYVSLDTLGTLRALRGEVHAPRLLDPAPPVMPEMMDKKRPVSLDAVARETTKRKNAGTPKRGAKPVRFAQLPRPVRPASPRAARPVVPRWVRYPLEFQLCGIGLGTRAVDKDRFNRIDRYGLFAMHGNPTAVVVPSIVPAAGAAGGGAAAGGAPAGAPGAGAPTVGDTTTNLTVQQQPPLASSIFPGSQDGQLPDWASAVTVELDNNHVQWLYNRG